MGFNDKLYVTFAHCQNPKIQSSTCCSKYYSVVIIDVTSTITQLSLGRSFQGKKDRKNQLNDKVKGLVAMQLEIDCGNEAEQLISVAI